MLIDYVTKTTLKSLFISYMFTRWPKGMPMREKNLERRPIYIKFL